MPENRQNSTSVRMLKFKHGIGCLDPSDLCMANLKFNETNQFMIIYAASAEKDRQHFLNLKARLGISDKDLLSPSCGGAIGVLRTMYYSPQFSFTVNA